MTDLRCDVAIVGAGTAGLAAERTARGAGASTLLIDERFAGTTCARVGCMPSKLLIAAGRAAQAAAEARPFGIAIAGVSVDGVAVMRRVRMMRDRFVQEARKSFDDLPDGVAVRSRARLTSPTELALDDGRTVKARAIVLATGSRPLVPEAFAGLGDLLLTNETVFELSNLPPSLAVIGAGPLGLELAQAFARLGVATEVFDEGKRLAGLDDEGLSERFHSILSQHLPIRLGVDVRTEREGDSVRLDWSGATTGTGRFSRLLLATGRPPSLRGLDLRAAGLELDDEGTPVFDPSTMQCGSTSVFLAGDVTATRPVLHEAAIEGEIAGRNAAAWPDIRSTNRPTALSIMFTDPGLAVIGTVDDPAFAIGEVAYDDQGRAKIDGRDEGFARLYARPDGRLAGAVLAAPAAEHMAHLIAWAIEDGATVETLLARPFYHPTLEEGLKTALIDLKEKLHTAR